MSLCIPLHLPLTRTYRSISLHSAYNHIPQNPLILPQVQISWCASSDERSETSAPMTLQIHAKERRVADTNPSTFFKQPELDTSVFILGRECLTVRELQRLKPGRYLSDEIINFYGALLQHLSALDDDATCARVKPLHFFNSFLFRKLEDGHDCARWTINKQQGVRHLH
jgi:Ulp1 family protease